jgi:hypothetical protein
VLETLGTVEKGKCPQESKHCDGTRTEDDSRKACCLQQGIVTLAARGGIVDETDPAHRLTRCLRSIKAVLFTFHVVRV